MSAVPGELAGVAGPQSGFPPLRSLSWVAALRRVWGTLRQQRAWPMLQSRTRRLQIQETVQLGEKRFVSILRVDGEHFLIGGSASGVVLLATMQPRPDPQSFGAVLAGEERQACV